MGVINKIGLPLRGRPILLITITAHRTPLSPITIINHHGGFIFLVESCFLIHLFEGIS